MKPLRILALMHPELVPVADRASLTPQEASASKTEFDVVSTLRAAGHEVNPLGVQYELFPIRDAIDQGKPHIVFNLLEEFHGESLFDQNVVSFLELMRIPYTGCNPRGMILSRGKALSKKLVAYHRIRVPDFAVFPIGHKVRRPARLRFPLIVKSLIEHASVGIARASVVDSDEKLAERVAFVHGRLATDAIAEQFIEGRELYVSVLGNDRLAVFPVWELVARNRPEGEPLIATAKVKHDVEYQERHGIDTGPARLPDDVAGRMAQVAKRIYKILELTGYARLDFRLDEAGRFYFLEANPNPEIAKSEEFAAAAKAAGVSYTELLERIVKLGLQKRPAT
jgi:D-alanine-D-alanine ligase